MSLWSGQPRKPALDDASPEGHYLQFGDDGSLIAITIVNARSIYEREGKIPITLPEHQIEATDLGSVLAAAQRLNPVVSDPPASGCRAPSRTAPP